MITAHGIHWEHLKPCCWLAFLHCLLNFPSSFFPSFVVTLSVFHLRFSDHQLYKGRNHVYILLSVLSMLGRRCMLVLFRIGICSGSRFASSFPSTNGFFTFRHRLRVQKIWKRGLAQVQKGVSWWLQWILQSMFGTCWWSSGKVRMFWEPIDPQKYWSELVWLEEK